ncbi:probable ATP-dependent RNA helicase DHX35 isoform X2 [Corticium candelabrum]|uniref:probable ATP-dependent RNA helicase DHX35 isoform X2 n=1 Tax=Corticium candelabrum TaxID=121492 RepID=UPI002E25B48E|nr:probable ATP-dependent RNA helicase DHX35 isoform X2 [Corticium candelabrum]
MSGFAPKFWRPGTEAPESKVRIERPYSQESYADSIAYNPYLSLSMQQQRQRLPVFKHRNHILYLLEKHQTVVIVGETGCGKSTQIPQYLYESGWTNSQKIIGVTQPRRVATTTVAGRVAEEMGCMLGQEVGYVIRFDDVSDPKRTKVKFLTDGLLVREMMGDPLLNKYSVLMLDEAHERSLYTDIITGLLKKILKKRLDLKLIVSSATLDAEMFRDFFNLNTSGDSKKDTAAILTVKGRMFPVDIYYSYYPVPDYIKSTVSTIWAIHQDERPGDILAFLTGQEEVERVVALVLERAETLPDSANQLMVLPMYGGLPASEQLKVFGRTPTDARKVVVATNIAEASITINGIVYVIDCGFVKVRAYNPNNGLESLVVTPVSQSSATQRSGRAGRVRSGKSFRLYTEKDFKKLPVAAVPEMQRSNLATVVLQLKSMGIDNVLRFSFLSPPPAKSMIRALDLLYALGGLDDNGSLTHPLGLQMAEFPLHPMFAKMLLTSGEFGCSDEAVTIAAMLQLDNIFLRPPNKKRESVRQHNISYQTANKSLLVYAQDRARLAFSVYEGDHLTMLNVYKAFISHKKSARFCHKHFLNYRVLCRAVDIREQLIKTLRRFKVKIKPVEDDECEPVQRCIVSGFFANAARLHPSGTYRTVRDDHPLEIHPTSVLYGEKLPQWVVFHEVIQTNKDYMRDITVIEPEWLYELAPHYYEFGTAGELAAKRAKTTS